MFLSVMMREFLKTASGPRGRVNAHWGDILRGDPGLRDVRVVVELVLGDRRYWVATRPMRNTSTTDGRTRRYVPALLEEPEITSTVEIFQQTAQARTITLQIAAQALDLHKALAAGATLSGVGEVALQRDGDDYDLRLVVLRGEATAGLDWGEDAAGVVQVQLSDFRTTQSEQVPRLAVDTDRWPSASENAIGQRYPYILNGYPKVPAVLVYEHAADPLYLYLGEPAQTLTADATYVNGIAAAGTYAPATDTAGFDGLGARVRYIDFGSSTATWETNDTVYVDVVLDSGEASLNVIGVLEHLYRRFTGYGALGLDVELFARAQRHLAGHAPKVLINASGEDGTDILSYIEGTYLPSFPMIHLTYTGLGVGPAVISRAIGPGRLRADFALTGGAFPLISRESDYTESPRESRYNSYEIRYNYNAMDNDYAGVLKVNSSNSRLCALGERFDGRRVADAVESPVIHTDALARYHLYWRVMHQTIPRYRVTWSAWPGAFLTLRPGMTGLFTDPARSVLTNVHATIVSVSKTSSGCSVVLDVWTPAWRGVSLLG